MSDVVALYTQRLTEPTASLYLDLLSRAIRAARLSKNFPDRRRVAGTLQALGSESHGGLYEEIYVDSRSGLPNMASFTRPLADRSVGLEALGRMKDQKTLDAQRNEAEVYARRADKRRYFELLGNMELAPVDEHRVFLRRHEPGASRASFRVELTKLTGAGEYLRIVIELTQTSGLWSHHLIDLDERGEVAHGTEGLRSMVYRFAAYDSETLFYRLHELDGVQVERIQRGIIGPVLYALPHQGKVVRVAEPTSNMLADAWVAALGAGKLGAQPDLIASFATDIAAADVREEKNNDPLVSLLRDNIRDSERARYEAQRAHFPFRVYKDRKFVATAAARPLVDAVCAAAKTKNLTYRLR
jgi:hypothetical protein